jgi:hypothetical protein
MTNAFKSYWILRLLLGAGVWLLVLTGAVMAEGGPEAAMESGENEEMGLAALGVVVVGALIGAIWDNFVASGLASFIVYGEFYFSTPPLDRSTPRPYFQSDEPKRLYQ